MLRRTLTIAVLGGALLAALLGANALGSDRSELAHYGPLSLLPPLTAILLVLTSRRVVLPLAAGVFVAAILVGTPQPMAIGTAFAQRYVWEAIVDPFHLAILVFTAALLGLAAVAIRSGGIQGIVEGMMGIAKTSRAVRLMTGAMGLAVFFDDYSNTAIVGPTVRPLFDRLRIPREKLAYIIDSTAAPVAGLAVVSTWVGAEVGYLKESAGLAGLEVSGYDLFFSAIQYRFYCVFALACVFIIAWQRRDFGPMRQAEERARTTGQVSRPGAKPLGDLSAGITAKEGVSPRASRAWLPIALVLGSILATTYILGAWGLHGVGGLVSAAGWRDAFVNASDLMGGNALAYVFAIAALAGSGVAMAMARLQGALSFSESLRAWFAGVRTMSSAFAILVLAWALSAGCRELGAAPYAVALVSDSIPALLLPVAVFGLAGVVAFATGTSWGTMAILLPMVGPLGYHAGGETVMVMAMAAVLDGAIFGDHCSPISDTTVLSSICSGCDHLDHIRTQLPYALLCGAVAATVGYSATSWLQISPLWGYLLGIVALWTCVRVLGQRIDVDDTPEVGAQAFTRSSLAGECAPGSAR